ncbi:BON domain-containing protein [Desulfonatronum thiosulfatophilum]|uniref:BON domain-containing protein n=1 Tax=Desulfonatronum thiosulfatophilum TaxID=617002 RepID=A0A1G6E3K7_9BACT|nr:BON domain-containing protein [Desulfonatronum thiosulfatophilum]SDB52034.1 BON domain-containing protein [Desulfonatronum thiosulfatophilum]
MKKTIIFLIIGALVVVGVIWFLTADEPAPIMQPTEERTTPPGMEPGRAITAEDQAGQEYHARMEAWRVRVEDIQDELADNGEVVRRTPDADEVQFGAAIDERITSEINARIAGDPGLSVFDIAVSTNEGRVHLSGTVGAQEFIGRAMALALDTPNVREVRSTIQVQ